MGDKPVPSIRMVVTSVLPAPDTYPSTAPAAIPIPKQSPPPTGEHKVTRGRDWAKVTSASPWPDEGSSHDGGFTKPNGLAIMIPGRTSLQHNHLRHKKEDDTGFIAKRRKLGNNIPPGAVHETYHAPSRE